MWNRMVRNNAFHEAVQQNNGQGVAYNFKSANYCQSTRCLYSLKYLLHFMSPAHMRELMSSCKAPVRKEMPANIFFFF